jgi:release factor glutamine methyltransferase
MLSLPVNLREARSKLRRDIENRYGEREANSIAALVLEKLTGLLPLEQTPRGSQELNESQQEQLGQYRTELLGGRPVQYVLGESWFCGLRFHVDERVLIPRPETEELVNWVLTDYPPGDAGRTLLDIGTGSGCIAIAIKKKCPDWDVWGCDISPEALQVARRNGQELGAAIHWMEIDFLDPSQREPLPRADLVLSNPPYIPIGEMSSLEEHVRDYEPDSALFVADRDPLLFYRAIGAFARSHPSRRPTVYVETHSQQGQAVLKILQTQGLAQAVLRRDIQGRERLVRAR